MPNPIRPQDLIDLDGLRANIAATRSETNEFLAESKRAMDELKTSSVATATELGKIKNNLSGPVDSGSITQYGQRVETLTRSFDDQKKAMDSLKLADEQLSGVQKTLTARTEELMKRYSELTGTSAKVVAEKKRIAKELVGLQSNFESLGKVVGQGKSALNETANTYSALSKRVADMRKELKSLDSAFDTNTGKINRNNKAAVDLQSKIQEGSRALQRMDASMGVYNRNVGNYSSAFGGIGRAVSGLALQYLSLTAAIAAGSEVLNKMINFERLDSGLRAAVGSTEAYDRAQKFLIATSDELNQNYVDLEKTYTKLSAATRNTSLEGTGTERIFAALVKTGTALQLSNEEVEGSLYAITQMISKGKVQAEELRGQLGERLPGAMRLLAEATGITEAQLNKMLESGEILAVNVLPQLATKLDETFGGDAKRNADNISGSINEMKTQFDLFLKALNENQSFTSFFSKLAKGAGDLLRELRALTTYGRGEGIGAGIGSRIEQGLFGVKGKDTAIREASLQRQAITESFPQQDRGQRENTLKGIELEYKALEKRLRATTSETDFATKQYLSRRVIELQELLDYVRSEASKLNRQERRENTRNDAARAKELSEQAEMQEEKNKKKRDAAAKKAQAEANRQLSDALQKVRAQNELAQSQLKTNYEAGLMTESEYISKRYELQVEGARKEAVLLVRAGKANSDEFIDAQKRATDALALSVKERKKMEDEAFKKTLEATREALQTIDSELTNGLREQIANFQEAYEDQRSIIEANITRGAISEKEGNKQIYALRQKLLEDIRDSTLKAAEDDKRLSDIKIQTLVKEAKTQEQLDAALELQRINNLHTEEDRIKALADFRKKYAKIGTDEEIKEAERAAKAKKELIDFIADQMSITSKALFDIGNNQREAELQGVESQKEHELELAGDNAEAKESIEKNYNRKVAEIRRKQAVADRAQALFDIAISTAKGVASVLSTGGGTAYADFGISAGLLSAIVIATGALQAAAVLSKPLPEIPQYFVGTDDAKEGPAWVAERGFEIRQTKNPTTGKPVYELLAEKQVKYLNRHDKIYTHEESKQMIRQNEEMAYNIRRATPMPYEKAAPSKPGVDEQSLERAVRNGVSGLPIHEFHLSEKGWNEYTRNKNARVKELSERRRLPRKGE